ncbi:MAG: L-histidine N(alpha)-methyltransferase [Gemmatimonadetes bacterium]|nr:L-histidine N(alpha)-methyltransferase [Gemmatimonadota bacterium]
MPEAIRESPARERKTRMLEEVRAGLSAQRKHLPSTYFYDRAGSRLFEQITRLPEYYLTRAERVLLMDRAPAWIAKLRPRSLIELGPGSAEKTRVILDALHVAETTGVYAPIDVSAAFLQETVARLRQEYPRLAMRPIVADMRGDLGVPSTLPRPALFAFLGSTIGNFERANAIRLLSRLRAAMLTDDRLLLGVDLKKDVRLIEAAYNDAQGVTAAFNRNVLRVLNRELGADFDPDSFEHLAFYASEHDRIEMHLVSNREQDVTIPGAGVFPFRLGESIRTEISCKYDRDDVESLFAGAGLVSEEWAAHPEGLFAIMLGAPAS